MKESVLEIKYTLDRSIPIEDVSYTEIDLFPKDATFPTKRIIYTIYLK